jgi:hypothetical protein
MFATDGLAHEVLSIVRMVLFPEQVPYRIRPK